MATDATGKAERKRKRVQLEQTYESQSGSCYYCRTTMVLAPADPAEPLDDPRMATWDHLIPKGRGGTNARENLVLSCRSCNLRKGSRTEAEFRALLASVPTSASRVSEQLIVEWDASTFTRTVNRNLEDGWTVVPGTLLIAAVTETDGRPGVRYAVVLRATSPRRPKDG
jgi:hypothetical protein